MVRQKRANTKTNIFGLKKRANNQSRISKYKYKYKYLSHTAVCSVQCSVCIEQCLVCHVQCAVCSVQFVGALCMCRVVCSLQCVVCSVLCVVCNGMCALCIANQPVKIQYKRFASFQRTEHRNRGQSQIFKVLSNIIKTSAGELLFSSALVKLRYGH